MDAPAAVLSLILVEFAVGGLVLTWFAPTWGKVRHGYEMLMGSTLALMLWGAWAALRTPMATVVDESAEAASLVAWTSRGLAAAAILTAGAVLVLAVRQSPLIARIAGILGALAGVATLVPLAGLRALTNGNWAVGVLELVLGSIFLGGIWAGMILGHWYLVERRLSNKYMVWMAKVNIGSVVAGLGSVALSGINEVPCAGLTGADLDVCARTLSPLLTVGNLTLWIGYGVIALIAVIAGFNLKLANEGGRSIQASTGMFYLAVILAPAAEFAAKLRFF
ncbi:MAG TPA: hypothetical protein VJ978_08255 [Nitriliruptoraceae bacterium]|nr:hypothetical protein [Nitriliruptoraceae bacterium]